jgi:ABC-type multidrug transport system fused ATPase/permease subunit
MAALQNYYNYYINTYISLADYSSHQVVVIFVLTALFAVTLFFRSYYFAEANLDESQRICHTLNENILMNQLSYYHSEHVASEDEEAPNSKAKLVCALTTDIETIADQFPFSTNIFANNVVVILSSMVVIVIEVPPVLLIMAFLVLYANHLNKVSHKKDEFLKIAMKEKDVDVYRVMSEMEEGKKYLLIHNRLETFIKSLVRHQEELYSIDWLNEKLKKYINFKYKVVMIGFLVVAVTLYSFMNVFTETDSLLQVGGVSKSRKSSSGLALLIQYTTQLSNYLLYFTMSIWEIKGQAVSIERVKPFLDKTPAIKNRLEAAAKILAKTKDHR